MVSDRLMKAIDKKKTPCIVGLDPDVNRIPPFLIEENTLESVAEAYYVFNCEIIDAIHDLVPAVKPQIAFYEKLGFPGIEVYQKTIRYAKRHGLIVIEDCKRNDIGSTATAYAEGHLGVVEIGNIEYKPFNGDMLTVNAYMGMDTIEPFSFVCNKYDKGLFLLVKTSNPGSGDFQDRKVLTDNEEKQLLDELGVKSDNMITLSQSMALKTYELGQTQLGERGYSSIGAVVGATYPEEAEKLRKMMPIAYILVPAYGAQGGTGKDCIPFFNIDGYGALINNSRGIISKPWQRHKKPKMWAELAREATLEMVEDIKHEMLMAKIYPW